MDLLQLERSFVWSSNTSGLLLVWRISWDVSRTWINPSQTSLTVCLFLFTFWTFCSYYCYSRFYSTQRCVWSSIPELASWLTSCRRSLFPSSCASSLTKRNSPGIRPGIFPLELSSSPTIPPFLYVLPLPHFIFENIQLFRFVDRKPSRYGTARYGFPFMILTSVRRNGPSLSCSISYLGQVIFDIVCISLDIFSYFILILLPF